MNNLYEISEQFDIESYKLLYPEIKDVYGVHIFGNELRSRLRIVFNKVDGTKKLVSYPKAVFEAYYGRKLSEDETVDHINNDPMDNRIENLQILSRSENIKKQHREGLAFKPPKGVALNIDTNGSKNGMSKISEEEVLRYRREYTSGRSKKSIVNECGLSTRTVENFLFGRTYKLVPEKCEPRPYERST